VLQPCKSGEFQKKEKPSEQKGAGCVEAAGGDVGLRGGSGGRSPVASRIGVTRVSGGVGRKKHHGPTPLKVVKSNWGKKGVGGSTGVGRSGRRAT